MKKISIFAMALVAIALSVITGCQKQANDSPKVFTLEDFQKVGKVYEENDPNAQKNLGKTKETAAVPILFDKYGVLYSQEKYAQDFEEYVSGKLKIKTYWTDLQTFRNVTNFDYATIDYAVGIPLNPTTTEERYVLDPYRKDQMPYSEREKKAIQKIKADEIKYGSGKVTRAGSPTNFINADVLVGKWTNAGTYGHACIVYTQSTLSTGTMTQHINATNTFDAWGAVTPVADQIGIKSMSTYWSSSNIQYRYLLKPAVALTTLQKNTIRSYHVSQDADTYSWSCLLSDDTKWYCSKLVWKSYKQIGRDIGLNPSVFVTPMDIANDPDMAGSSF